MHCIVVALFAISEAIDLPLFRNIMRFSLKVLQACFPNLRAADIVTIRSIFTAAGI